MGIKCLFNIHQWNGCKCEKCGKIRYEGHVWKGCKCELCGTVRDEGHDWNGCVCSRCKKTRHKWADGICKVCGEVCHHPNWEVVYEKNYGTMDYDSAGRSVDDFVVTLYRCGKCGQLKKEGRGDFCGDPHELTDITEEDYKIVGT